jgi:signal transduction histidine kinase
VVEDLEAALLVHNRELSRMPRTDASRRSAAAAEAELRALQREMPRYIGSAEEAALLQQVNLSIDHYMQASLEPEASEPSAARAVPLIGLDRAFELLDRLVQLNVKDAGAARERAERWDAMANRLGFGVAALLSLGAAGLITWLWGFALRPLFALTRAIEHFSSGDRSARAERLGAKELRETADRFNEMAAALERERKNQLASLASVAHDLRNPLAALRTSLALVDVGGAAGQPERVRKALEISTRQVETLERMVGDLMDEACIEAGQLELQLSRHDARTLVRDAVELCARGTSRSVSLCTCDGEIEIVCDPVRISQVLNNLIGNAMKYSPASGTIDVAVEREESGASVAVTDCGVGIPAEELGRLFEPFHRASNVRKIAPGVGLGLSVAKRVVERHGGRIEVRSEPGRGSTFRVFLPSCPPESPTPSIA